MALDEDNNIVYSIVETKQEKWGVKQANLLRRNDL